MEKSINEKIVLERIVDKSPELQYPLRKLDDEESIYEIPEDEKSDILKQLWPFLPIPDPEELMFDIHEESWLYFKECQILRWHERNLVVSKFYESSGGMSIDLMVNEIAANRITVLTIRK